MPLLIEQIEARRDEAARLIESKRGETVAFLREGAVTALTAVEMTIDALIIRRSRLPDCPWGCGGKLESVPQTNVKSCDTCKSVSLRGRY